MEFIAEIWKVNAGIATFILCMLIILYLMAQMIQAKFTEISTRQKAAETHFLSTIANMESKFDNKFSNMELKVDTKFEKTDVKIDGIIANVHKLVNDANANMAKISAQLHDQNGNIKMLTVAIGTDPMRFIKNTQD